MNRFTLFSALLVSICIFVVAAELEQRTIRTRGLNLQISVPKDWPAFETNMAERNAIYYRIGPADTNYSIQLYFDSRFEIGTNRLTDRMLESHITASLKPVLTTTVEKEVETHRFGAGKDGVYARLTDRAPKQGEFKFYTRGVRLIGTNVMVFALVSNDENFSALSNTLAVVESVKVVGKTSSSEQ